ncbi:MAG TPA: FAD-linked oxidase C-terminal domain-containing protein [Acidimicrobiia bacterium]|nr:FAD-linked oxidase C-terminal domain-containing protein [Acidimicrobiia bacterium]
MTLVADLRAVLGDEDVLEEPVELHLFSKDASLLRGRAACVVFPEDSAEVAEVVKIAETHRVPVVARGAGTGLTAGASPTEGGIVVVTTAINDIDIDPANRTAWVGAGVINLDLSRVAAPHGLYFAPDPSSQSACTIGGNVANNSGGPHCLSEGSTTSHVLGMEVVLAGGEIVVLGGPAPDPLGLDLKGIIVGSEGTLGIVTRALVRLLPIDPDVRTLLMDFPSIEDAARTVSEVIAAGLVPAALELMDQRMCQAVENWLQAGLPVDAAAVLLAEVVGETEGVESQAQIIAETAKRNHAIDVEVAKSEEHRALLWKGRKSAFGAIAQLAPDYYLHDAVVPRTRLVETMKGVYEIADRYGLTMLNVFHAGDGNLHPLIAFDASDPVTYATVHRAGEEIVALCLQAGGALSGEHGVGVEKRDMMRSSFTELDLDAQARLKEVFDPANVFNPSKILPEGSRCFDFGGIKRELPDGAWV